MVKIRQERTKKNWSQSVVAKKLGITKSAYSNIETLKRRPSYEILVKLENLFNLSHRELFAQLPNNDILTQ